MFIGLDITLGLLVVVNGRKREFQICEVPNVCSCRLNKVYQGSLLTAIEICFLDLNGKVKSSLSVYEIYAENWMQLNEIEKQAHEWELVINSYKRNPVQQILKNQVLDLSLQSENSQMLNRY